MAVYLEAEQRAEIQRIAKAEDATASQVHRVLRLPAPPRFEAALTDAEVSAALAADWRTPFDDLVSDTPEVLAMLRALAPVYDSQFAPEYVTPPPGLQAQAASDARLQPSSLLRPAWCGSER